MRTIDDLAELTRLVSSGPPLYIRYSTGPEDDAARPSRDYEADVELPGLPAASLAPEPWWPGPPIDWIARRVCMYLDIADKAPDRRAWVLRGRVAGAGTDHEPLVTDVVPVAWLSRRLIEEARRRYRERFRPGRDSTEARTR